MTGGKGLAEPLGVTADEDGINVAVWSGTARAIEFCLFAEDGAREVERVRLPGRTGGVFHGRLEGIGPGARYGLRAHGKWDPANGYRFNAAKLLLDPFATAIDRPFALHPDLFDGAERNGADSAHAMPKAMVSHPEPPAPERPPFSFEGQVIYELHVRGFTRNHPSIPAKIRGTFAGLGHPAAIAYLRGLGVTAVELMPCAAAIDERHLLPLGLSNYWGYNGVGFLTPDPRLAPGGWPEIRRTVATLQEAGMAVLLDVVLNHTGEGDEAGPTLSLRGLDNAGYYRLRPDDPSRYVNDTGCGHTLALDRPPAVRLATDALRCWVRRAGVDGFRFDLAPVLGRQPGGFDPAAPLLSAINQDPMLRERALIAEPWDVGPHGYRLGDFPDAWGEWNDRFRDTARRFWRGDGGMLGEMATRFAGSADIFGARHRPLSRSINFAAIHDGFTLADVVAYERKHNEANGEHNRDGTDDNHSWNNGIEGPSEDAGVRERRRADVRALLATVLLARGTPMLGMGDECGRTQGGNNNAYAQDNPTSWFDWAAMDGELLRFTARLIAVRRACPVLLAPDALTGKPSGSDAWPDVVWLTTEGEPMTDADWAAADNRTLALVLRRAGQGTVVVLNAARTPWQLRLPRPSRRAAWRVVIDTSAPEREEEAGAVLTVRERSVVLLLDA